MTQYISLNVKLSNSKLNKLKSAIKNETDTALRLSSNMIGNSNDKTNFHHKLLLDNRQVTNLPKAFPKSSPVNIKLSKTQLSKMMQLGGFLGRLLGSLLNQKQGTLMPPHTLTSLEIQCYYQNKPGFNRVYS